MATADQILRRWLKNLQGGFIDDGAGGQWWREDDGSWTDGCWVISAGALLAECERNEA
jgi:hypothetical protein